MPSTRTVAGVGTDRSGSRLAAAAGPPRHRLTLNSTHRTQSQNTATNATHGHGLLRLGHRHRLPLPAQIKHLPQGGGDERPAVAVRARVAGDGSPIERTRSCCSRVGAAARRASHPQIPRRTPSRGRGRAAGAARARREARGGVGGGGGAGGGGHGAGARGWRRARHPRALCGRRSASHACGQRRRVVRRAESRRARCARSPRAGGVRAVAARWWATGHRGERGASEEHTGQCAVRDSQIAKSNKNLNKTTLSHSTQARHRCELARA